MKQPEQEFDELKGFLVIKDVCQKAAKNLIQYLEEEKRFDFTCLKDAAQLISNFEKIINHAHITEVASISHRYGYSKSNLLSVLKSIFHRNVTSKFDSKSREHKTTFIEEATILLKLAKRRQYLERVISGEFEAIRPEDIEKTIEFLVQAAEASWGEAGVISSAEIHSHPCFLS